MPKHMTHLGTGLAVGSGSYALKSWIAGTPLHPIELLGAATGGAIGGIAPDLFEPASSPHHRNLAHSCLAALASAAAIVGLNESSLDHYCRERAEFYEHGPESATDDAARYSCLANAYFWRFTRGALLGLPAGYLSHLLLDATTPMGLPLVTRAKGDS